MASVLFIHRSVGRNLLADGKVYGLASQKSPGFSLSDYNQNSDVLSSNAHPPRKMGFVFPGGDTKPADYAALFSDTADDAYKSIRDFATSYDVIIIKSCYPNANIVSDEQLEAAKANYQSIAKFFAGHPDKKLVIMTTPPLRRFKTSTAAATRARLLATWLATQPLGENIRVFNFFDLLANPEATKHANTLYGKYCRLWPFDSHPNAKASRAIAPLFVDFIVQTV